MVMMMDRSAATAAAVQDRLAQMSRSRKTTVKGQMKDPAAQAVMLVMMGT